MSAPAPAPAPAAVPEEFPHKAFIGNLSFKTTKDELNDFFAQVVDVKEANVMAIGTRSLGYGFVTFGDEASLQKAIAERNGKELGGRVINVEVARPITEETLAARKEKTAARRRQARNRKPRGDKANGAARVDAAEEAEDERPQQQQQQQGRGGDAGAEESASPRQGKRRPRRFPKKDGKSEGGEQAAAAATAEPSAAAKKDLRKPSETVAFVGNLPFSTTDEELSKLFADFTISSAHVVFNQRSKRPKGFGFVTFASPADHSKAIAEFTANPLVASGRELFIKAALSETPVASEPESSSA
ncbi:hypothetical protein LPJ72_002990 [Coemansia sp. Benny D160-2]|nr:hypothetical protein LPJ72_002990 [Coemansia sp. Benny D160-2]